MGLTKAVHIRGWINNDIFFINFVVDKLRSHIKPFKYIFEKAKFAINKPCSSSVEFCQT